MAACCGTEQCTPFCPQCGKALNVSPVQEVLNQLRRTWRTLETRSKGLHARYSWTEKAAQAKARLDAIEALVANQKRPSGGKG